MIRDQIQNDLKQAMLSRNAQDVSTLRGLKSALQYAEVASPNSSLSEGEVISVLRKESKKRLEASEFYIKDGNEEKGTQELAEKKIIDNYLPASMDESQIAKLVDEVIADFGQVDNSKMGQIIGKVRAKAGPSAEGSAIAKIVKSRLIGN